MATASPSAIITDTGTAAWQYIGPDERGRELEIIAVEIDPGDEPAYLLVIHVMPTSLRR
jgi:hypothetical protein